PPFDQTRSPVSIVFSDAFSSPRGAPASGSPSESAAERAGDPQRAGAKRRSPRGSPVGTPHQLAVAAIREETAEQRTPGGRAEAERVRRGTPSVAAARNSRRRPRPRSMPYTLL